MRSGVSVAQTLLGSLDGLPLQRRMRQRNMPPMQPPIVLLNDGDGTERHDAVRFRRVPVAADDEDVVAAAAFAAALAADMEGSSSSSTRLRCSCCPAVPLDELAWPLAVLLWCLACLDVMSEPLPLWLWLRLWLWLWL